MARKKKPNGDMPPHLSHLGNRHGLHALKQLVALTTMLSPTRGGFHMPTTSADSTDGSIEKPFHRNATHFDTLSEQIQRHLRWIFDELCEPLSFSVSRETFAAFLHDVQGEDVLDKLDKDRYKFEEFLETWSFLFGWKAYKNTSLDGLDRSKSIANYFINSSHNTYLRGNQLTSSASADAYRQVIERDCRCIEIDVWNPPSKSLPPTPVRGTTPVPQHRRHLSSTSISSSIHDGLGAVTRLLSGMHTRSRAASTSQLGTAGQAGQQATSTNNLDPNVLLQRPRSARSRSRSSSQSRSRGHSNSRSKSKSRSDSPDSDASLDEPVVMHAHTFNGKDYTLGTFVGFREVCRAIMETAFVRNPLPIIISLEVHTDNKHQEKMVDIMKEEWGDHLVDKAFEGIDPRLRLPTLEELKYKILVKVKKPMSSSLMPTSPHGRLGLNLAKVEASGNSGVPADKLSQAKVKIGEKLGALGVYSHSESWKGKSEDLVTIKTPSHIFSLDENDLEVLQQTHHREMFRHNRTYLMRAYPSAMHFDSSNMDPSPCWRRGVQMVALNWQRWDEGMMLNHAMFAGQPGWVLKPSGYGSSDNTTCPSEVGARRTLNLSITIFSGQHLPIPSQKVDNEPTSSVKGGPSYNGFRPVVKCELYVDKPEDRCTTATTSDTSSIKAKECVLKRETPVRQTDHPDWGHRGHTMKFENIPVVVEELSFVRFKVDDQNVRFYKDPAKQAKARFEDLAGWACFRLDRLQQGYRFIDLLDAQARETEGKLLVRIEKTFGVKSSKV